MKRNGKTAAGTDARRPYERRKRMIDFQNASIVKLREERRDKFAGVLSAILVQGEEIVSCYQGMRDYVVFTTKRLIAVNVQGFCR